MSLHLAAEKCLSAESHSLFSVLRSWTLTNFSRLWSSSLGPLTDVSPHYNQSMRRNSLGLEEDDAERRTDGMEQDSFASTSTSYSSPPLVPFSFPPRNTAPREASDCPSSPPLVALSFNTYSFPTPSTSELVQRPQRPVPHPLISTSKLRLEMTPLPAFHLPLPDVEMSPPWSTLDVGSLAPDVPPKARKNSLVSLPVAPPTPPLTPNEELPNFDWKEAGRNETRGRSRQVTPLAKVSYIAQRASHDTGTDGLASPFTAPSLQLKPIPFPTFPGETHYHPNLATSPSSPPFVVPRFSHSFALAAFHRKGFRRSSPGSP